MVTSRVSLGNRTACRGNWTYASLGGRYTAPMEKLDSELLGALQACRDHAKELLTAANAVLASGQHNVAYHLAVLACEEIGKCELLIIDRVSADSDVPASWPKKHTSDHTQKLFWFFFEAAFRSRELNRKTFEDAKALAQRIHFKRLASLYVDTTPDGVTIPKLQVTVEETEALLKYATIRLEAAERNKRTEELSEEDVASQRWLTEAMRDDELSKLIFSEVAFKKMMELDGPREWVRWLQGQVKDAADRGKQALERELERNRALPFERTRDNGTSVSA